MPKQSARTGYYWLRQAGALALLGLFFVIVQIGLLESKIVSAATQIDAPIPAPVGVAESIDYKSNSGAEQPPSPSYKPPFARRTCLLVVLLPSGIGLLLWGWYYLNFDRRVLGVRLMLTGALSSISGVSIYLLMLFPATWGWPL